VAPTEPQGQVATVVAPKITRMKINLHLETMLAAYRDGRSAASSAPLRGAVSGFS